VELPAELTRNAVAAWGEDGRAFIERLPEQVATLVREWSLTLAQPYPMSFHWVCAVRLPDGGPAVLKLGPPGSPHLRQQAATLRHFDGRGAVRLLAHDVARGALLLERAVPGTPVSAVPPELDVVATAAIITVVRRLHRPPGDRGELPDLLQNRRQSFVDHLACHPGDDPFPRRLVTRALGLLQELCASASQEVVVHGDLHHDNVLRSSSSRSGAEPDPWLAIDPHGVVGDPGADVGAMLYNPALARRDPALVRLVPARIEQLADGLALPLQRVIAWGFVEAVVSEVWTAEERGPLTRALDVALALEPQLS
jgi:streptomycin 6-kinase